MAGIDLVGVQVIHRLKLGDEHGVVVVLADVARDLALFELRDHAVERGELHNGETVMMAPGGSMYATPGKGKNEVRMAYVLESDKLERAMEILKKAIEAYNAR